MKRAATTIAALVLTAGVAIGSLGPTPDGDGTVAGGGTGCCRARI